MKNNDTSYASQKVVRKEFLAFDIASIDIVSNVDFDAEHLAGTSLNDIMLFHTVSVYPYVKSGYQTLHYLGKEYHPVNKLLKDTTADDWKLCGTISDGFYFEIAPIQGLTLLNKTHNITIKLTADDGRIFENTIRVSWE